MDIRSYTENDFRKMVEIHEKYFKDEFECPNFGKNYLCAYVVEDNQEPIVIAGVRPIAELVAVTDMSKSTKKRVIALKEITRAGIFTCGVYGFDQLHCFVQGEQWSKQVQTVHFRPTRGQALVLDVF